MGARRVPREGERWLSAVLLVTVIVAISAAVRLRPTVSPSASSPARLASRPLYLMDGPRLMDRPRILSSPPPRIATSAPILAHDAHAESPATTVAPEPLVAAADTPVEPRDEPGIDTTPTLLVLASRRLQLTAAPSSLAGADAREPVPSSAPHGLVDLPAVAVTRAVSVAGRGIMSGLRATSAMFRAAF